MGFETVLLKTFDKQFISFASNKGKVVSEEDAGTKFIEEPKSDGRILFSDINNKNIDDISVEIVRVFPEVILPPFLPVPPYYLTYPYY